MYELLKFVLNCFIENKVLNNQSSYVFDSAIDDVVFDNVISRADYAIAVLHIASFHGYSGLVKALIDMGVDVNMPIHPNIRLPSIYIEESEYPSKENISDFYYSTGATITCKPVGRNVVPLHRASSKGHSEVVKSLIHTADINVKTTSGRNALYYATHYGHHDVARLLIDNKAKMSGAYDNYILHSVVEHGHLEILQLLIESSIYTPNDLNTQDDDGETVLYRASKHSKLDIVKFLIANGAHPTIPNREGKTPLHCVSMTGNLEIAKILLDACEQRGYPIDTILNKTDNHDCTPLQLASGHGRFEVAKLLYDKKARIGIRRTTNKNALHMAAENGHIEIVRMFINGGEDINCTCRTFAREETALQLAQRAGHAGVVALLGGVYVPPPPPVDIDNAPFNPFMNMGIDMGMNVGDALQFLMNRGVAHPPNDQPPPLQPPLQFFDDDVLPNDA